MLLFHGCEMRLTTSTILVLASFLLAAALPTLGQAPKHRKRITTKHPKALVRCSHSSTNDFMLCGPPVTLQANSNDVVAQYTVTVQVTIDEAGNVVSARAVSGNPNLYEYALENATRQKFAPKLLSGKPVKVTGVIVYKFENP
jgi:Gram-negative bacterial TonB protein C-terminal